MQEYIKKKCEFVPVSDELLYRNPALLFCLVPYRRDYRCHREFADTSAVRINRCGLPADKAAQLLLLKHQQQEG